MNQVYRPRTLGKDLTIQHVGEETLIYDESRHLAFCLNRTSAAVWTRCDGTRNTSQIAADLRADFDRPVSNEIVEIALQQMQDHGLLEACQLSNAARPVPASMSRRSMMSKAGAGAVAMLPMIAAIMAPKAAQAYSGGVNSYYKPEENNKQQASKHAQSADSNNELEPDHQQASLAEDQNQSNRNRRPVRQ